MSTATTSTGPPSRAAGTSITERLVGALTTAWAAIQARHADVPDVVLTLGSGTLGARRGEVTWGHFAAGRWHLTTAGEHAVTARYSRSWPEVQSRTSGLGRCGCACALDRPVDGGAGDGEQLRELGAGVRAGVVQLDEVRFLAWGQLGLLSA